jgi:phenylalanyl-tRNA synthetase beta chain
MNVSYRWLRDLAPSVTARAEELAELLAARGFPVENIEGLAGGLEDLVVARVVRVREHPDADRLVLCDVDYGVEEHVQVVCGAPNVVADGWYPFAPVGATLPGGFTIGKAKLRGQLSEGMLCSEEELELGPDGSGLMTLEGAFSPGEPLVQALGLDDVRLEVEVTSNRPDLLSHVGIAREVAPAGDADLSLPDIPGLSDEQEGALAELELVEGAEEASGGGVTIRIQDPDRCPAYLGLVLRGVQVGPSPGWLQDRLRAAGARPINNVVDATNYVLLELGHPLHAFDLDRLEDRAIVVRRAEDGEAIRTLDGVDRKLTGAMLAICDARRPVAVAGVMGGENSEVDEGTTDVLLECALFSPGPIRDTRKELGLSTDASYRFERGVDPEGLRQAILRTARIILASAGGLPSGPLLAVRPAPFERRTLSLRPARAKQILGVEFSGDDLKGLLSPLGFGVEAGEGGVLTVQVPGYRSWDVTREVDLVEEVARMHGYDAFPDTLGAFRPGTVPDHPLFLLEDRLRRELAGRGLLEAHTLAFAPEGEGEVEILNPVSRAERFLRSSLLPGLLRRVEYNLARGNRDVRLFELGTTFAPGAPGELPAEKTRLGVVLHGRRQPPHWTEDPPAFDIWDVKGLLQAVGRVVGGQGWKVRPSSEAGPGDAPLAAPGDAPSTAPFDVASGLFLLQDEGGRPMGVGGRVRASVVDLPPWAGAVWALEISLPELPAVDREVQHAPLPSHPGIERDLAMLVDRGVSSERLLELIREHGGEHLRDLEVFDVYEGKGVPEGKRSVAVRMHFRARGRTLKESEVDVPVDDVIRILQEELDVQLRGQRD